MRSKREISQKHSDSCPPATGPIVANGGFGRRWWLMGILVTALFAACAEDLDPQNPDLGPDGRLLRPVALFDLQERQKLPWPNVVAQTRVENGEPVIGRINLDNPDEDPLIALFNTQSGFTRMPVITADFSRNISQTTLIPGSNLLFLAEQDPAVLAQTQVTFDEEFQKLRLFPQRPLEPAALYVVVLTKSIEGEDGRPIQEDLLFRFMKYDQPLFNPETGRVLSDLLTAQGVTPQQAAELEGLRQQYQALLFANPPIQQLVRADYARYHEIPVDQVTDEQMLEHIAVAWAFQTMSEEDADPTAGLQAASDIVSQDAGSFMMPMTFPAQVFFDNLPGVPFENLSYMASVTLTTLDFAQNGVWLPDLAGAALTEIQALIAYPQAATQMAVPVVIFQHGLRQCKEAALPFLANALAGAGMASIAIDAVGHGERTLVGRPLQEGEEPGACDRIENDQIFRSGEAFITFDNLLVTRDNFRQSAVDLVALARALSEENLDVFDHGGDFTQVYYAGHSLGGVLGSLFMDVQPYADTGVLNAGGAWLSRIFTESPSFSAQLMPALADRLGVEADSEAFQDQLTQLLPLLQGIMDPADPAYYAQGITAENNILLQEITNDPVIPNVSTRILAGIAGLELLTEEPQPDMTPVSGWTRFMESSHGVLLSPLDDEGEPTFLGITQAVQEQLVTYLASDGTVIVIPETTTE